MSGSVGQALRASPQPGQQPPGLSQRQQTIQAAGVSIGRMFEMLKAIPGHDDQALQAAQQMMQQGFVRAVQASTQQFGRQGAPPG
jgi:hypothetical protein